jgi:hypothetical protein
MVRVVIVSRLLRRLNGLWPTPTVSGLVRFPTAGKPVRFSRRRHRLDTVTATPRTLLRFPGPLALLRVLEGAPPTLHRAGETRVFLADERLWDWPGPADFGALAVFDADRFAPEPHPTPGWYVCRVATLAPGDALYVPDAESAAAVFGAPSAEAARPRLPPQHGRRVAIRLDAMRAYDALAAAVEAARDAGESGSIPRWPASLRALLNRPLHLLTAAERAALAATVALDR